jgi:biotin---protein ligase
MPSALLNVLIYSGPGTCEFSVNQTLRTLKRFLKSSYDVRLVGSDVLKNDRIPWDESCALFVMPGGRDLAYLAEFRGSNFFKRLKGNVKYLGICAGAYFAADKIEFELGRVGYEVKGDRPLKLIDSCAKGTIETGKLFYYGDDPKTVISSIQAIGINTVDDNSFKVAYNGGCYFPQASSDLIYASYENNQPIILLKDDNFCLSGVHFEYDPIDCLLKDKVVFSELLKYETERKSLVKDILRRLGLKVADEEEGEVIETIKIFTNFQLDISLNDKSIKFITKTDDNGLGTGTFTLPTKKSTLLYSQICTSTQTILLNEPELLDLLPSYSVYVADHQIRGKGRSNNYWISSPACLQFTLKVENPMISSTKLPLIQFLMALTLTETINSLKFNNSALKAKIKWPNDVYLCENDVLIGKISGILINCLQSHQKRVNHVLIGIGVNLLSDPSLPNISHLNDYLVTPCSKEEFLNELIERFSYSYQDFLSNDSFPFQDFYSNWLHSNQIIETDLAGSSKLRIKGINQFGYLMAKDILTGNLNEFEPDGNSFDMMRNLIKRK